VDHSSHSCEKYKSLTDRCHCQHHCGTCITIQSCDCVLTDKRQCCCRCGVCRHSSDCCRSVKVDSTTEVWKELMHCSVYCSHFIYDCARQNCASWAQSWGITMHFCNTTIYRLPKAQVLRQRPKKFVLRSKAKLWRHPIATNTFSLSWFARGCLWWLYGACIPTFRCYHKISCKYTVVHKKGATFIFSITLANIDGFS